MSLFSKREAYLDDYTNNLQCEDFYDDRWADTDWGWLEFFADEEPEYGD